MVTSGTHTSPPLVKEDLGRCPLSVAAAVVLRPSGFVCSGWPAIRMLSGGCAAGEAADGSRAQEGGGEPLRHAGLQFSKAAGKKKKKKTPLHQTSTKHSELIISCFLLLLFSWPLPLFCGVEMKKKKRYILFLVYFFLYIRLYFYREI